MSCRVTGFRAYKDFSDAEIDTIELMLMKLYSRFDIDDSTDLKRLRATDYPIMQDLYDLIDKEYNLFDSEKKHLYTEENLQNICLGLHSMCKGAESRYFNGHTNIRDTEFLCFGVKGIMDTNKRLNQRDAGPMSHIYLSKNIFLRLARQLYCRSGQNEIVIIKILERNVLPGHRLSDKLLNKGNTAAAIDELYLFLTNLTAIEYIRNAMKRVRKKESVVVLASQNVDDFLMPEVKEFTKPLFSIPTHQFFFYAGTVEPRAYTEVLQIEMSEFSLINYPSRGSCFYRCGNERYLLQVIVPDYKARLFGKTGGR